MNNYRIKVLSLLSLLIFSDITLASINLNISQTAQTATSIDLQIGISGLNSGGAPALSSYDFDIGFDPNKLSFVSAVFGDKILGDQLDLFGFGANPSTASITGLGVLNLSELSFDSVSDLNNLQADSFSLVSLNFNIVHFGASQLNLTVNGLADAEGNALAANNLSVPITAVPEQPVAYLMLFGLLSLAAYSGKINSFNIKIKHPSQLLII